MTQYYKKISIYLISLFSFTWIIIDFWIVGFSLIFLCLLVLFSFYFLSLLFCIV